MKISNNGLKIIEDFEGFVPYLYLCDAYVLTIGIGATNIDLNDRRFTKTNVKPKIVFGKEPIRYKSQYVCITKDVAYDLKKEALVEFEKCVNEQVKVPISQNQYDALISLVFNIGVSAFTKSSLLVELNKGNYGVAADKFLDWNKVSGKVNTGLSKRRGKEKNLFLKND